MPPSCRRPSWRKFPPLARFISMALSSSASSLSSSSASPLSSSSASSLSSSSASSSLSEVFSGAKAKTPDANLSRVQDGSPDKIPRSNLACTYPIHLSHSGSVWPISYSTHFPATPALLPLIQRIQPLAPLSSASFPLRLHHFIQYSWTSIYWVFDQWSKTILYFEKSYL